VPVVDVFIQKNIVDIAKLNKKNMKKVKCGNLIMWAVIENIVIILVVGFLVWKVSLWGLILLLALNSLVRKNEK
jgi:hypothetical protein